MAELLEPPTQSTVPAQLQRFAFTKATAVEASKKAVQGQKNRIAQLTAEVAALKAELAARPVIIQAPPPPEKTEAQIAIEEQLQLIKEQIARTRKVLDEEEIEHHHRAQLLRALDSLLDRQRKLLGIPDPGSLKPSAPRKAERSAPAVAVQEAPIVVSQPTSSTPSALDNTTI